MLAHSIVKFESSQPSRYMIFLHGILGTRANWRGIARSFVKGRPDWGAILVDLPQHGDSLQQPPPHTLKTTAADVRALDQALSLPVRGAVGHSFGGKVALEWLAMQDGGAEIWLIDSSPGPKEEGSSVTAGVLMTLESLKKDWPSREAFVQSIVEAGQPEAIAQWLAMNLNRNDDGSHSFGPDLSAIRSLIEDYAKTDLWPVVESPSAGSTIHVVIGGRSSVFSRLDRARVEAVAGRDPGVFVHIIEDAGHWVHVDAAEELVALLTSAAGEQP
ncbi:MAG: alpha/beta hydrolase [Myxococcales bacterium]|nr:alpha/beta hydrolase [Myxococcales bacterium]MDH3482817.1 alpha/beta hydrolase [Myxococcales bacterium]